MTIKQKIKQLLSSNDNSQIILGIKLGKNIGDKNIRDWVSNFEVDLMNECFSTLKHNVFYNHRLIEITYFDKFKNDLTFTHDLNFRHFNNTAEGIQALLNSVDINERFIEIEELNCCNEGVIWAMTCGGIEFKLSLSSLHISTQVAAATIGRNLVNTVPVGKTFQNVKFI